MNLLINLIFVHIFIASIINASESIPTKEEVTKLYVATFNRAPDAVGLDYWVYDSDFKLSQIAQSFFDQEETRLLYPLGTSSRDFIQSVYQNLFNRTPDIAGWDYWENALDTNIFSKNRFIEAVINGAKDGSDDATILNNKTAVGLYFAEHLLNDVNSAKLVIVGISASKDTVSFIKSKIDNGKIESDVWNTYSNIQSKSTFVMIHFEAGYQGRLNNDLPINIPQKYMTTDLGWQEYLFDTAKKLVQKANDYGFHLTLAFNPQWAEYILLDNEKVNLVKQWQKQGHEISFHHHSMNHPDWNGYSNDPSAINNSIPLLGNVDTGLNIVRNLASPINITTAMIGGLPIDMPQSYKNTTDSLIFASGNQYNSFEQYGELRSLKPYKITKENGAKITYVTHRQLTSILTDYTINEALEIFKREYNSIENEEIYGVVFHCYDYHEAEETYNNWFEFIKNNGDSIKTIGTIISDYKYDIPIQ